MLSLDEMLSLENGALYLIESAIANFKLHAITEYRALALLGSFVSTFPAAEATVPANAHPNPKHGYLTSELGCLFSMYCHGTPFAAPHMHDILSWYLPLGTCRWMSHRHSAYFSTHSTY